MKQFFLFILFLIAIISCNQKQNKNTLNIKELAYEKALYINHNFDANRIYRLDTIYKDESEMIKGCFIRPSDTTFFFSFHGDSPLSNGNAQYLNMLAHLDESTLIVDYYEQGARPDTILDFNHDGVDDFFFKIVGNKRGVTVEIYNIVTFKDSKPKNLLKIRDESYFYYSDKYSKELGDTLFTSREIRFKDIDNDKKHEAIITSEFKIYNGGETDDQINDSIKIANRVDTIRFN